MLPLRDDVPGRTVPFVTVGLVLLNILVYVYQASLAMSSTPIAIRAGEAIGCLGLDPRVAAADPALALVCELGAIPCRLLDRCASPLDLPPAFVTVFTAMFLHGGLLHLGGNMLYLWIFGNNVEDTLGHGRYLLFYLASGTAAALAQALTNPESAIPMIGASGAVSGVLGAYLIVFPHATILTLITFGFFIRFVHVPAVIVLGFWVVVQFFQGYLSYGVTKDEGGGVAWFAHIGGFVAGILLLFLLRPARRARL